MTKRIAVLSLVLVGSDCPGTDVLDFGLYVTYTTHNRRMTQSPGCSRVPQKVAASHPSRHYWLANKMLFESRARGNRQTL